MADGPENFRDPKVTSTDAKTTGSGGMGKWIGIALAVIVALLVLGWLLGLFADDDVDAVEVPAETGTVVETN